MQAAGNNAGPSGRERRPGEEGGAVVTGSWGLEDHWGLQGCEGTQVANRGHWGLGKNAGARMGSPGGGQKEPSLAWN